MRPIAKLIVVGLCLATLGCASLTSVKGKPRQAGSATAIAATARQPHSPLAKHVRLQPDLSPRDTAARMIREAAVAAVEQPAPQVDPAITEGHTQLASAVIVNEVDADVPAAAVAYEPIEIKDEEVEEVVVAQETSVVYETTAVQEPIDRPYPAGLPVFRPGPDETDQSRFDRRVVDVPLDIRPVEGVMPDDPTTAEMVEAPSPGEWSESELRADIVCSFAPWTICYRPLYFEDIALERYGRSCGLIQPAISGARFFGSVALLPYKMTVRPPRSCVCSNGFSRPGDCPLRGYGRCVLRADAVAVQAAVVAGIVFILP